MDVNVEDESKTHTDSRLVDASSSSSGALNVDDLTSVLQRARISEDEATTLDVQEREVKRESSLPDELRRAGRAAHVDVYIAPAVLGHRWTRSRSVAHVVERPERLRASLLGLAALVGRLHADSPLSLGPTSVQPQTSNFVAPADKTLSSDERECPIRALLSYDSSSLCVPSEGLSMIHASGEAESLQMGDIQAPPLWKAAGTNTEDEASTAWLASPTSYVSLLRALCHHAMFHQPEQTESRTTTKAEHNSRDVSVDLTDSQSSSTRPISPAVHRALLPDGSFASEVPFNWPQGDLYLCGLRQSDTKRSDSSTDYFVEHKSSNVDVDVKAEYSVQPLTGVDAPSTPKHVEVPHTAEPTLPTITQRGSLGAIEASLGACCAALERVMGRQHEATKRDLPQSQGAKRAFVLARPPGHHCTAARPSGFCWVNNVAVTAAEAYARYGVDRVAILDFDLHHGDGTQAIVWQINAQTQLIDAQRQARLSALAAAAARKASHAKQGKHGRRSAEQEDDTNEKEEENVGKRGLKIFYGSVHDIESFPCEDGDQQKVTEASMCIEGAHGQWIHNVHLESHPNQDAFDYAYRTKYAQLIEKADRFFQQSDSSPEASLILISAGFDACVHEHGGMQRHGKNVPTDFYTRFTRDVVQLANLRCHGRCISLLEGGYSDKALTSGVAAHLAAMADLPNEFGVDVCLPNTLTQLDRVAKISAASMRDDDEASQSAGSHVVRRRADVAPRDPAWLRYTLEAFKRLQETCGKVRIPEQKGSVTAPSTPYAEGWTASPLDRYAHWQSPRETRSSKISSSAKVSPIKPT